jgi:hypothetical protein
MEELRIFTREPRPDVLYVPYSLGSGTLFGTDRGTLSRRWRVAKASDDGMYLSKKLSSKRASRSLWPLCEPAQVASPSIQGETTGYEPFDSERDKPMRDDIAAISDRSQRHSTAPPFQAVERLTPRVARLLVSEKKDQDGGGLL